MMPQVLLQLRLYNPKAQPYPYGMKPFKILALLAAISTAYAGTVTKREFTKNGVVYIEEFDTGANGVSTTTTYPKPGQETTTVKTAKTTSGETQTTATTTGPGFKSKVSVVQSKEEQERSKKDSKVFVNAIASCSPFQTVFPHPMMKGENIKIQVHGLANGNCKLTQTMPGGGLQTCLFTEAQRKDVQSTGQEALQSLMANTETCQISGY